MAFGGIQSKVTQASNPLHNLDARERQVAQFISEGKPVATAIRLAGYSLTSGYDRNQVAKRVMPAVEWLRKKNEEMINCSRKQVLEGFLAAIEQAKLMSEPMVQVAGWREIGKMCGYYAPEVKEININVGAKRVIGQLEVMSDQELLELITKDEQAIVGEAHEVLEPHEQPQAQTAGD